MVRRAIRLPKEQILQPEDRTDPSGTTDDVEGHGFPLTPPPGLASRRGTGHGGEAIPTADDEDDVEGPRVR
jgi:hypothetical protein